jgi:NIPSNAP
MIHELRIYHCVPGRLPALMKRFESVTLALWERHGIRQVGFWTVAIGPSSTDLYYLLEWTSLAEREAKWNAFMSDPEWVAKRAESEKDGPILTHVSNLMLQPTAFSKMR